MAEVVVEVQCPHRIGLCYLTHYDGVGDMLAQLPCPCNDPSVIIRWFVEVPREPKTIEEFLNDPS